MVLGRCSRCDGVRSLPKRDVRPISSERYPSGWADLSRLYRAENPLCEECERHGRTTPAKDVHHVVPVSVRPDLALSWSNLMSVCRKCHWRLDRIKGEQVALGQSHIENLKMRQIST